MMDEKDIIGDLLIDPNLDAYEQFFDHKWCERMFGLVKNSPLRAAFCTLVLDWRCTNGVHRLPWLMVENLRSYADGDGKGNLQFRAEYLDFVLTGLVKKLDSRMRFSLTREQRMVLKRVVAQIEKEAFAAFNVARNQIKMNVAGYWEFVIGMSEFQFSLVGTQATNYGMLFFAYEDFLANTIRMRDPDYTSKNNPIKTHFSKHFGDALAKFCWTDDEIELPKQVRHALAHNGQRYGPNLDQFKSRFVETAGIAALLRDDSFNMVNGKIRITPGNTRYLFGVLKDRVAKIISELA